MLGHGPPTMHEDPPRTPPDSPSALPPLDDAPLDGSLFGPDHACFGCATDHPIGFRLRFERAEADDGTPFVQTRFTPGELYQGPPGLMHGGLVATLADEVAAWTIVALRGRFAFTAAFDGRLKRPVRIGRELLGRGRITRPGKRLLVVRVELHQGDALAYEGDFRLMMLPCRDVAGVLQAPIPAAMRRFCGES